MNWREVLIVVKPETVIKWHGQGFRLYWRWKSKTPVGRPKIDKEIRELIRKMSRENPLWGVPRIQAELRLLGLDLAESTVAKYRVRSRTSPSQTWKTFLANHTKQIAAVDFGAVPTITFRNLYYFVVLLHDRRQVIHFNVTASPTAVWTDQQGASPVPTHGMYQNAPQSFVAGESRNAAMATLQRIALTEKLLGCINRRLQRTHLQAPNP